MFRGAKIKVINSLNFWLLSFFIKFNQQILVGSEIAEKFYERSKLQEDKKSWFFPKINSRLIKLKKLKILFIILINPLKWKNIYIEKIKFYLIYLYPSSSLNKWWWKMGRKEKDGKERKRWMRLGNWIILVNNKWIY